MDEDDLDIVREAVRTRLRNETLERAVGRTIRRRGLDFAKYIKMMSDLRDYAQSSGECLDDAVSTLLGEVDDECEGDDG